MVHNRRRLVFVYYRISGTCYGFRDAKSFCYAFYKMRFSASEFSLKGYNGTCAEKRSYTLSQ